MLVNVWREEYSFSRLPILLDLSYFNFDRIEILILSRKLVHHVSQQFVTAVAPSVFLIDRENRFYYFYTSTYSFMVESMSFFFLGCIGSSRWDYTSMLFGITRFLCFQYRCEYRVSIMCCREIGSIYLLFIYFYFLKASRIDLSVSIFVDLLENSGIFIFPFFIF